MVRNTRNCAITVSRYSGVDEATPFRNSMSANTKGASESCSGGRDTNSYSLTIDGAVSGSVVFCSVGKRNKPHSPGNDFTERIEVQAGISGFVAGIAVSDFSAISEGKVTAQGRFSSEVDWAGVAVVINPASDSNETPIEGLLSQYHSAVISNDFDDNIIQIPETTFFGACLPQSFQS